MQQLFTWKNKVFCSIYLEVPMAQHLVESDPLFHVMLDTRSDQVTCKRARDLIQRFGVLLTPQALECLG